MQWFRSLGCLHVWDYYVRGCPDPGEPSAWKVCRCCGKRVIESYDKK